MLLTACASLVSGSGVASIRYFSAGPGDFDYPWGAIQCPTGSEKIASYEDCANLLGDNDLLQSIDKPAGDLTWKQTNFLVFLDDDVKYHKGCFALNEEIDSNGEPTSNGWELHYNEGTGGNLDGQSPSRLVCNGSPVASRRKLFRRKRA